MIQWKGHNIQNEYTRYTKQTDIYENVQRGPLDGKPFLQTVRTHTNLNLDLEILFLEWKAEWIITDQGHNIMDDIVYKARDRTQTSAASSAHRHTNEMCCSLGVLMNQCPCGHASSWLDTQTIKWWEIRKMQSKARNTFTVHFTCSHLLIYAKI